MRKVLSSAVDFVSRVGRLMVGVPDYDTYVRHRMAHHPDGKIMTYEEFFRERQESRYGGSKIGKCC